MKLMLVAPCTEALGSWELSLYPGYMRNQISSSANSNLPFGGSSFSMWISSKPIAFSASFGAVAISAPTSVHRHCQARLGFNL